MSSPHTEATRKSILEACRGVAEAGRSGSWTMEEVADRAGVTRMTVYRYFPSRVDLLVATVRYVDEVEQVVERFSSVGECATALDALDRWVDVWVDYVPHIQRLAQALLAARHVDEAAESAWCDRMASLRDGCRLLVGWMHRDGLLSGHLTIEDATDLMWAMASVQVWDALTRDRGWTPRQYASEMSRALLRVLVDD